MRKISNFCAHAATASHAKLDIFLMQIYFSYHMTIFLGSAFISLWKYWNMDEFFRTAGMKPIGKVVYAGAAYKKDLPKQIARKIERCLK